MDTGASRLLVQIQPTYKPCCAALPATPQTNEDVENFLVPPSHRRGGHSIHLPNGVLAEECLSNPLSVLRRAHARPGRSGWRALLLVRGTRGTLLLDLEVHLVYVAARPDGVCLALLVENNRSAQLDRVRRPRKPFDLPEPERLVPRPRSPIRGCARG